MTNMAAMAAKPTWGLCWSQAIWLRGSRQLSITSASSLASAASLPTLLRCFTFPTKRAYLSTRPRMGDTPASHPRPSGASP